MHPIAILIIWVSIFLTSLWFLSVQHESTLPWLNLENTIPCPPTATPPPTSQTTLPQPSLLVKCPPCLCERITAPSLKRLCHLENEIRPLIEVSQNLYTPPDAQPLYSAPSFPILPSPSHLTRSTTIFLQVHDKTNITEDLGISFLKIGFEYVIKEKKNRSLRVILCLIIFALSMFSKFSQSIDHVFHESCMVYAVKFNEAINPYISSGFSWVIKIALDLGNRVLALLKNNI